MSLAKRNCSGSKYLRNGKFFGQLVKFLNNLGQFGVVLTFFPIFLQNLYTLLSFRKNTNIAKYISFLNNSFSSNSKESVVITRKCFDSSF